MSGLSLEAFKRRNKGKGYAELLRLLKSKNDELLRLGGTSKKNVEAQIKFIQQELSERRPSEYTPFDEGGPSKIYGSRSLDLMKNKIRQEKPKDGPIAQADKPNKLRTASAIKKAQELRKKYDNLNFSEKRDVFDKRDITKNKGNPAGRYAASSSPSSDTDKVEQQDEETNVLEKFVSKLIGRNIQFKDIPDDDPDFDVGYKSEGHFAYPAGRPDLKKGGMTAKSAATTEFRKPLGMKGGGLTRSQKQRIARLTQEYKQKKARKSNGKRTNR